MRFEGRDEVIIVFVWEAMERRALLGPVVRKKHEVLFQRHSNLFLRVSLCGTDLSPCPTSPRTVTLIFASSFPYHSPLFSDILSVSLPNKRPNPHVGWMVFGMQLDINFAGLVTRLLECKRNTLEQSDQRLREVYMRFHTL